ncbi:transcription termination factor NusA [bacterium]|nr:transcription termination factor NusA [FCB group bacterium]MBL7191867.1 transcription termination factor NusA [bacterium]
MNQPIVEAIQQIVKERDMDKEAFQELIQGVFFSVIKKLYGTSDNFDVIFNMEKGDIEIYCEKMIVEDGEVEDTVTQVELSQAREEDPDFEVGDEYVEIIDYHSWGRRAIITLKQNLIQRIKEIEKENIFSEFSSRVGEIVIGDIHQINRKEIRFNIGKIEAIMPQEEQIYNERYRRGESIRALIKEVRKTSKDPEIILSRADTGFIKRMFELEVPEIYDNIIEIKEVAREAGDRTKIAVESNDKRIDPVGACVGMKGVRIQAIVRELNNEKIDIINYAEDPELFIRRAMAPVIPTEVLINRAEKKAVVVIPDESFPAAIGRKGQNIRLASMLTGYELEPVKESEYYEEEIELKQVEQLDEETKNILIQAGYQYADEIIDAGIERLIELPEIDENKAKEIFAVLEKLYEEDESAEAKSESVENSEENDDSIIEEETEELPQDSNDVEMTEETQKPEESEDKQLTDSGRQN